MCMQISRDLKGQVLVQQAKGEAESLALLTSSPMMPALLVPASHSVFAECNLVKHSAAEPAD